MIQTLVFRALILGGKQNKENTSLSRTSRSTQKMFSWIKVFLRTLQSPSVAKSRQMLNDFAGDCWKVCVGPQPGRYFSQKAIFDQGMNRNEWSGNVALLFLFYQLFVAPPVTVHLTSYYCLPSLWVPDWLCGCCRSGITGLVMFADLVLILHSDVWTCTSLRETVGECCVFAC